MENIIEIEESKGKNKGFTLIELLIVIVILGILAAVTVFAVRGITDKGKSSACKSDKKAIEVAVESYFAQYGLAAIPIAGAVPAGAPATYTVNGPAVIDTLTSAGYFREAPTTFSVSADGKTLTAAGSCVGVSLS